jgi:hypothetical protein
MVYSVNGSKLFYSILCIKMSFVNVKHNSRYWLVFGFSCIHHDLWYLVVLPLVFLIRFLLPSLDDVHFRIFVLHIERVVCFIFTNTTYLVWMCTLH